MPDENQPEVNPMNDMTAKLRALDVKAPEGEEPKMKAAEAPEPEKPAKPDKAEKAPEATPETPEIQVPKIDPESLEFVPKNAQQWKDAKSKYQTQIDEWKARAEKAEAAASKIEEFGGEEKLKEALAERDELRKQIRMGMAERDPELQKRFKTASQRVIDELKANVTGTEAADLVSIIERQGSASRAAVRKFIADHPDMDRFVVDDITAAVGELNRLERERQTLIEESVANWDNNISQHQQMQQQQMQQARQNLEKAFVSELEAAKDHPFLSGDGSEERVNMAKAFVTGALTPSESSRLALMAASYAPVVEYLNTTLTENQALKAKIAEIEKNAPGAGAAGGKDSPPASTEFTDPRKATYAAESAGEMLARKLRAAGHQR